MSRLVKLVGNQQDGKSFYVTDVPGSKLLVATIEAEARYKSAMKVATPEHEASVRPQKGETLEYTLAHVRKEGLDVVYVYKYTGDHSCPSCEGDQS